MVLLQLMLTTRTPWLFMKSTVACAAVYFYARLAHALVHISGFGLFKARTVLFTIAWIAFLVYAIVVLQHAF